MKSYTDISGMIFEKLAADPVNAVEGYCYWNSVLDTLRIYRDPTGWLTVGTVGDTAGSVPVGGIVAYNPGYYANSSNGTYTVTGPATNDVAGSNAYLPDSWVVCDGAAVNDASSPIWNSASRHVPNLSDTRFVNGSTSCGSIGGSNTLLDHTHTHSLTNPDHTHTDNLAVNSTTVNRTGNSTAAGQGGGATNSGYFEPPFENYDGTQQWQISGSTGGTKRRISWSSNGVTRSSYARADNHRHSIPSHTHNASSSSGGSFALASSALSGGITSSGSTTVTGTIGSGVAAPSTLPVYVTLQYIIRIK